MIKIIEEKASQETRELIFEDKTELLRNSLFLCARYDSNSNELGVFSDSESEMSEISEESDTIEFTEKSKEQESSCQIQ